jgi:hypothetical protein
LLVDQPVVADVAARTERGVRQESERAKPVVDGHDDDVALGRQPPRVVDVTAARNEAAAVDPYHYRALPDAGPNRRGPYIQGEAVLAGRLAATAFLDALRTGFTAIPHSRPRPRRPRRLPAQRPHWWCGIRNILKKPVVRGNLTSHQAHSRAHDAGVQSARATSCRRLPGCAAAKAAGRDHDRCQKQRRGTQTPATKRSDRHKASA